MENISKSIDWLNNSKDDLRSANILYDHQLYAHSIFHLQQSVEKATKSYGMAIPLFKERELRIISHKPFNVFIISRERLNNILESYPLPEYNFKMIFSAIEKNDPNVFNDFIIIYNEIKEFWNKASIDCYNKELPIDDLKYYLEWLKNIDGLYVYRNELINNSEDNIINSDKIDYNHYKDLIDIIPLKQIMMLIIDFAYVTISLFCLCVITQPHATTRYVKGRFNPKKFYNKNLPLINEYNNIAESINKTQEILMQFYMNNPITLTDNIKHILNQFENKYNQQQKVLLLNK